MVQTDQVSETDGGRVKDEEAYDIIVQIRTICERASSKEDAERVVAETFPGFERMLPNFRPFMDIQ